MQASVVVFQRRIMLAANVDSPDQLLEGEDVGYEAHQEETGVGHYRNYLRKDRHALKGLSVQIQCTHRTLSIMQDMQCAYCV